MYHNYGPSCGKDYFGILNACLLKIQGSVFVSFKGMSFQFLKSDTSGVKRNAIKIAKINKTMAVIANLMRMLFIWWNGTGNVGRLRYSPYVRT
jgi:hypothetical protein